MRILFTGGGTGGHVFPIIAVKESFKEGHDFYYLGPDKFAKEQFKDIKARYILAGGFRRYFSFKLPLDILKIFIGIIQSLWYLFLYVPDVIFSKGGYGSFPVVLVGWIYRIPIVLHDSDSVPGLANRILSRFAKKVILSFSGAEKYFKNSVVIGNPVRKDLLNGNEIQARRLFGITSNKPVVLILGGSQGARKINEIVFNTLPRLLQIAEIIHVSGKKEFKFVQKRTNKPEGYHLYPFLNIEHLKHAYTADLIVNRAGAGSIFEIAALGKPSILIPIPKSALNHQRKNAYEFSAKGEKAIVLDQANLTPNMFLDAIDDLLKNKAKLQKMGLAAKSFYNIKTPELIRDEILKIVK